MKKKIYFVGQSRSNFLKISPIYQELIKYKSAFQAFLIHTGAPKSKQLPDQFFLDLNLPKPNIHLGLSSGNDSQEIARTLIAFDAVLEEKKPHLVIVVGDTNASLACSLSSKKRGIKVAHIETGIRSFDLNTPKEVNQLITEQLSDIRYTTRSEVDIPLLKLDSSKEKTLFVGNTLVDIIKKCKPSAGKTQCYKKLGLKKQQYSVLTLQDPDILKKKSKLKELLASLKEISSHFTMVAPLHPTTLHYLENHTLLKSFNTNGIKKSEINIIEPVSYLEMLNLLSHARCVISDNNTIQEETTALKIPCLPLKEKKGSPYLVSLESNILINTFYKIARKPTLNKKIPKLWDGKTAPRIVKDLLQRQKKGQF